MEQALRALRQLSAGLTTEAAVWKAAALVPADAPDADAGADGERGELYTWGRATNYQLGYGAKNEQQIPRLVQVPLGKQVTPGAELSPSSACHSHPRVPPPR